MIDVGPCTVTIGGMQLRDIAHTYGTPTYAYDLQEVAANLTRIQEAIEYRPLSVHFALMSNANPLLLRAMRDLGIGAHVSCFAELELAMLGGFGDQDIVVTGCNFTDTEIQQLASAGVAVNADSLVQLTKFVRDAGLKTIGIRLNSNVTLPPGILSPAVGPNSRHGIAREDICQARAIAAENGARIVGVQMYIGTNITDLECFLSELDELIDACSELPDVAYVDLGGGFGVKYKNGDNGFPWECFGKQVTEKLQSFGNSGGPQLELKLEPGRAVIANAGLLIATVTDVKRRNERVFVGTDTSLSNFARPYIYGRYHRIVLVCSEPDTRPMCTSIYICGNSVASRDILSEGLGPMPEPREGDLVVILDTGAYGFSMSSHFCGRLRPAEVLVDESRIQLIRNRETVQDLWHAP
ncbi:MAG: hypothetical protein KAV87_30030 [Desulfobacteraceae bacterium]|nr:hypothetical protein [Desulfobacteraceae bacterium]